MRRLEPEGLHHCSALRSSSCPLSTSPPADSSPKALTIARRREDRAASPSALAQLEFAFASGASTDPVQIRRPFFDLFPCLGAGSPDAAPCCEPPTPSADLHLPQLPSSAPKSPQLRLRRPAAGLLNLPLASPRTNSTRSASCASSLRLRRTVSTRHRPRASSRCPRRVSLATQSLNSCTRTSIRPRRIFSSSWPASIGAVAPNPRPPVSRQLRRAIATQSTVESDPWLLHLRLPVSLELRRALQNLPPLTRAPDFLAFSSLWLSGSEEPSSHHTPLTRTPWPLPRQRPTPIQLRRVFLAPSAAVSKAVASASLTPAARPAPKSLLGDFRRGC